MGADIAQSYEGIVVAVAKDETPGTVVGEC